MFFFKQKTAYEMRISDWSSDVCSSDLSPGWQGMMGLGFVLESIAVSTALAALPIWLASALLLVAVIGWAGWNDPLATRTLATLLVYALLIGLFARADNLDRKSTRLNSSH